MFPTLRYAFTGFAQDVPVEKMPEPKGGDFHHTNMVQTARKNAFLVIPEVVRGTLYSLLFKLSLSLSSHIRSKK